MNQEMKGRILETVRDFHLPRYEEIPNVGLYLEQVTKYISECCAISLSPWPIRRI